MDQLYYDVFFGVDARSSIILSYTEAVAAAVVLGKKKKASSVIIGVPLCVNKLQLGFLNRISLIYNISRSCQAAS